MSYTLNQPANRWEDAIPTGNGPLGALVFGHVVQDWVVLNHHRCWIEYSRSELPHLAPHLPEIRRLQAEGRWAEAANVFPNILNGVNYRSETADYHPLGEIWIHHHDISVTRDYRSSLDLKTGEVVVGWTMKGRHHERRLFVSRADDVIALTVDGWEPGELQMACRLRPHGVEEVTDCGSGRRPDPQNPPITWDTRHGNGWHAHIGLYEDGREFGAVLKSVPVGGGDTYGDQYWGGVWTGVKGAQSVLVLVKSWWNEPADSAIPRLLEEIAALPADYQTLLQRHIEIHEPLVNAFSLDLGADEADRSKSNNVLTQEAFDGDVPNALVERMVAYQRHLLVTSAREDSWPANLQGRWNAEYRPPWNSDYHNDINIQMNYWIAPQTGLANFIEPLADFYFEFLDDYRHNARQIYGCRGILLPINMGTHGQMRHGAFVHWTAGAGWMAQHWWEHWLVTGDREFLRTRTLPWLQETAAFYLDFVEVRNGVAHFSPSISPENHPPGKSLTVANATMDVVVCRETLTNLLEALRVLEETDVEEERYRKLLAALPPYEVNAEGGLREWLHPDLPDCQTHRHLSHLYGLFPGWEINQEDTPEFYLQAVRALELRQNELGSMAGWSLAFMANLWARSGQGERALENLELLLRGCTTPNLLSWGNDWRAQGLSCFWGQGALPPFQIEAGLGFVSAVCEMLVRSRPEFLYLLPALPSAWPQGNVRGITTRCGVTVDLSWSENGHVLRATLHSRVAQQITLRLPDHFSSSSQAINLTAGSTSLEFRA
ncbi:MAG TPA: glycoside hydrolase N-terminal domain-containing protein [Abditibacteriaceae bacterium]|jgi:alpha-L-fucosidase 2